VAFPLCHIFLYMSAAERKSEKRTLIRGQYFTDDVEFFFQYLMTWFSFSSLLRENTLEYVLQTVQFLIIVKFSSDTTTLREFFFSEQCNLFCTVEYSN